MSVILPFKLDYGTVNAIANSILALMMVVFNFQLMRKLKVARWIRYLLMIVGLYWCALYAFVAIVPEGFVNPYDFGQIFVRPAFTFTLAVMAASALYRLKSS